MAKIKSILIGLIICIFFSNVLFADYKENMKPGNEVYKQNSNDSSGLILIAVDVVLTGFAVVTFMDYSASSDDYEKLYTAINETTEANYKILEYEKKQIEQKGTLMAFACGAAGVALTYTVLDIFVFHNSFNTTISASINPFSGYAGLNVKWRL